MIRAGARPVLLLAMVLGLVGGPYLARTLRHLWPSADSSAGSTTAHHTVSLQGNEYRADYDDPFVCAQFTGAQQFAAPGRRSAPKGEPKLPPCTVGGIVMDPAMPMAILVFGGQSRMVKQGDLVDSVRVRTIDAGTVTVVYRNKVFALRRVE